MSDAERAPRTLDIQAIMALLPHRYPILLVDRVLDYEPKQWIRGLKNITMNEQIFQGHFPKRPVFPGVMIVEAMAQCGGCLVMQEFEDLSKKVIYFMSMDAVKFRKPVVPGDTVEFHMTRTARRRNMWWYHGEAKVNGVVVAEADLGAMISDR